jgi:hypothetical protein
MREKIIETVPRTVPKDQGQADTLAALSSAITGFELTSKPKPRLPGAGLGVSA